MSDEGASQRAQPDEFETTATRPLPESGTGSATTPTGGSAVRDDIRPAVAAEPGAPGTRVASAEPETAPAGRRPVRMRTVVVGIVLLAIAVLANLRLTTTVDFQLGTVVLGLMIGCGVLLIVGASRRE